MGDATCSVDSCNGKRRGREWCTKHYQRWKRHGTPHHTPQRDKTPFERFFEKVDVGDCWHWTAGTDYDGYGIFSFEGRDVRAHRWLYEQLVGAIPAGLQIDHLCRNTGCVNPDHLEPVTGRVNVHRSEGLAAHNYAKTRCHRGHPFDAVNTRRFAPRSRGCRECERVGSAERTARHRQRKRLLRGAAV